MTARAAAKSAGCPQSTLSGWIHGATPTNFHHAKRLAEVLGVSFSYLMTGEADAPLDPREVMVGGETVIDGIMEVKVRRVKVKRKDPG